MSYLALILLLLLLLTKILDRCVSVKILSRMLPVSRLFPALVRQSLRNYDRGMFCAVAIESNSIKKNYY